MQPCTSDEALSKWLMEKWVSKNKQDLKRGSGNTLYSRVDPYRLRKPAKNWKIEITPCKDAEYTVELSKESTDITFSFKIIHFIY